MSLPLWSWKLQQKSCGGWQNYDDESAMPSSRTKPSAIDTDRRIFRSDIMSIIIFRMGITVFYYDCEVPVLFALIIVICHRDL